MTHPPLGLTCPVGGKGNKRWCGWVMHVEQLSRIIAVEEDDAGERARVTTEDEAEGRVERGKCMPGESNSLRRGAILRARDILPWRRGGIEGGGEGEGEEVVSPRSGIVPVRVVWVRFAAVDEKGVVDDSDGLAPSRQC